MRRGGTLFWLRVLCVSLCALRTTCSGCAWLRRRYGAASGQLLSLLAHMGGQITREPLPVPFPHSLYSRISGAPMQEKVNFMSETLNNIGALFDGDITEASWDRAQLDHFRHVLYRQFQELQTCVSTTGKYRNALKNYFRKLNRKILKKMNYSSQSWELIRKAVHKHLQRLDLLWTPV